MKEISSMIMIREYDPFMDLERAEAMERMCEVGPSGELSIYTDLLGDPLCRVRHSPAFLMLLDDWVLCRIYRKIYSSMHQEQQEDSCNHEELAHPLYFSHQNITQEEIINNTSLINILKSSSISEFLVDYSSLLQLYDTQPEFNTLVAQQSKVKPDSLLQKSNK